MALSQPLFIKFAFCDVQSDAPESGYAPPLNMDYRIYLDKGFALVFFEMLTLTLPYEDLQRHEHKKYVCQRGKRPKIYSYYGLPFIFLFSFFD